MPKELTVVPPQADPNKTMEEFRHLVGEIRTNFTRLKGTQKFTAAAAQAEPIAVGTSNELVETVMSLLVSLADVTYRVTHEEREWAGSIEEELDELRPETETQILPDDAYELKSLLLELQRNLRTPNDADDTIPALLTERVTKAVALIDEATIVLDPDADDGDEDDEDEEA